MIYEYKICKICRLICHISLLIRFEDRIVSFYINHLWINGSSLSKQGQGLGEIT